MCSKYKLHSRFNSEHNWKIEGEKKINLKKKLKLKLEMTIFMMICKSYLDATIP